MKPWKDLFCTHILERGRNYYEENKEPSGEFNKNICRYVWAVLTE